MIFNVTELIHTDEENFENPLEFKPERFLDPSDGESSKNRHPFAFIPFRIVLWYLIQRNEYEIFAHRKTIKSAGTRNCIGQKFAMIEMKIILSMLLLDFDMEPVLKTDDVIVASDGLNAPFEELLIKITKKL